ncbi:MAG: ribonuclease PH [Phycisphaerae bacterium]|nr:ribonuclease PH [Phycisphaerae bacterium]
MATKRHDGRKPDQLRDLRILRRYTRYAGGSVLIATGQTQVLCTAFAEPGVPAWLEGAGKGWLTAEYGMLPSSTPQRKRRPERTDGRAQEIQRLIGRSLRAVLDLARMPDLTIAVDCDVLQADGGTRTAAVTGAYVALVDAVRNALERGLIAQNPITGAVAAVSAGIVDGRILLDLDYVEDSSAELDFNVVMTDRGQFVEVQGTAEKEPFDRIQLDTILKTAGKGIRRLIKAQKDALKEK